MENLAGIQRYYCNIRLLRLEIVGTQHRGLSVARDVKRASDFCNFVSHSFGLASSDRNLHENIFCKVKVEDGFAVWRTRGIEVSPSLGERPQTAPIGLAAPDVDRKGAQRSTRENDMTVAATMRLKGIGVFCSG